MALEVTCFVNIPRKTISKFLQVPLQRNQISINSNTVF